MVLAVGGEVGVGRGAEAAAGGGVGVLTGGATGVGVVLQEASRKSAMIARTIQR